ncbi:DNA replication regulator SLD3-domain-containing protein [Paraphoma chrysanthemicola]|nr:DNA replication regulator SLD3-domain-containing protein [Paraphoma chrysanthemicola]
MSTYALQTKTMLQSVSRSPIQLLEPAPGRDEPKAQLPSKRKREAICGLGSSNKPFTIKPYLGAPDEKPATFKPVRVIGRSQLPLTFLDTTSDENFAANALFSAHIAVLEDDEGVRARKIDTPNVLIARYDTKRTLYAIERVRTRVYNICRLASWLKEKDVGELWDPSNLQAYPTWPLPAGSTVANGAWWQHAVVQTQPVERPAKRPRMSMMRKQAPQLVKDAAHRFDSPVTHETNVMTVGPTDVLEEPLQTPSPQEQLESLVQQYLDTIYLSKTSLAYFAKGPLTRIRNAFTSPEEGAPPTHELVTFVRSMLLSPKASEKKYFEKLPATIKALPPGSLSDEEASGAVKAKKTKKKLKLSRDGLYPHEETLIKRWWISDMPSGESRGDETMEQRIRRRIGDLRVRETLAQLTLMLEVIALETLSTYKPPPDVNLAENETQPLDDTQTKPKKRKRKLDDVSLQLDLLLDRLCIWHATEEAGILDFDTKPTQQYDDSEGNTKDGASDRLRGFCVEVIIPFYMNRLPEQALMINKKLGGPAHTSPPKRKAMKPPVTSRKSGEPKEPEAKKSRRSLARVATDTMRRTTERTTPSLNRSATDSALFAGIKREVSEAPLSAIPFQRSPSKNNRRSMSQFRHLEGRELDLTTPSAAVTAKLKQKQRVEDELKEAITALKKPNRGLAAGGYIEDMERRSLGSASRSRKQANPTRKMVKDVQVTATPRVGRRTKDMIEQTPNHHYHTGNPFQRLSTAAAPPLSDFCIASSGAPRSSSVIPGTVQRSATGRHLAHASIAETPSKAPNTKVFESGGVRRTIFATPLKPTRASHDTEGSSTSHIFESPAKVVGSSPPADTRVMPAAVATPTKPINTLPVETISAALPKPVQDTEPNIYAALGWDEDDD